MNYFIQNSRVVFLNDLQIKSGKYSSLKQLTNKELEKHLSGKFDFDGVTFVEKNIVATRVFEIYEKLNQLDSDTIRPWRTIQTAIEGQDVSFEQSKLNEIEAECIVLRVELAAL